MSAEAGSAVVRRVQTFPLEYEGVEPYGTAKSSSAWRAATLVKVTTSDGTVGWGECSGRPALLTACLHDVGSRVLGQPVERREGFWIDEWSRNYHAGTSGPHVVAMSGVDQALWDAQARSYGVNLSALLGGRVRDRVQAYASTGYYHPDRPDDRLREYVESAVGQGFTAVKIKIGGGVRDDHKRASLARTILGESGRLMADYNANATVDVALASLSALKELNPYWAEEPLPPHEVRGWDLLRSAGVRLAAGEALHTRYGFRDYIGERYVDIVQPNLSTCGGFTEAQAIAHLSSAFNLRVVPHAWGTGVLLAATLQLLSVLPESPFGDHHTSAPMLELDQGDNALRDGVLVEPIRAVGGIVDVPTGPGLGVDVDEDGLVRWTVTAEALDLS